MAQSLGFVRPYDNQALDEINNHNNEDYDNKQIPLILSASFQYIVAYIGNLSVRVPY